MAAEAGSTAPVIITMCPLVLAQRANIKAVHDSIAEDTSTLQQIEDQLETLAASTSVLRRKISAIEKLQIATFEVSAFFSTFETATVRYEVSNLITRVNPDGQLQSELHRQNRTTRDLKARQNDCLRSREDMRRKLEDPELYAIPTGSAHRPFSHLPDDLVLMIFAAAFVTGDNYFISQPWCVCRRWRHLIRKTPSIQRSIKALRWDALQSGATAPTEHRIRQTASTVPLETVFCGPRSVAVLCRGPHRQLLELFRVADTPRLRHRLVMPLDNGASLLCYVDPFMYVYNAYDFGVYKIDTRESHPPAISVFSARGTMVVFGMAHTAAHPNMFYMVGNAIGKHETAAINVELDARGNNTFGPARAHATAIAVSDEYVFECRNVLTVHVNEHGMNGAHIRTIYLGLSTMAACNTITYNPWTKTLALILTSPERMVTVDMDNFEVPPQTLAIPEVSVNDLVCDKNGFYYSVYYSAHVEDQNVPTILRI